MKVTHTPSAENRELLVRTHAPAYQMSIELVTQLYLRD